MAREELIPMGKGVVMPPEFTSKFALGDTPLIVKINQLNHSKGDDCSFLNCTYPDGRVINHQLFLPVDINEFYRQVITNFNIIYGKNVSPKDKLIELSGQIMFEEVNDGK